MRNQFEYYGLKTPVRRAIQKPFLHKEYLPKASELFAIITELWDKPQREFQHFGQEIAFQYIKNVSPNDMALYEFMVTHKSWWDTVDFIATKLMAYYFKVFPEQQKVYVHKWVHSNNIWLQRCALLFALKYKDHLDTDLLTTTIYSLLDSSLHSEWRSMFRN